MPPTSPIHEISDSYVDDVARLDPINATYFGVTGHDDRLTDYSPEGDQARADLCRATLRAATAVTAETEADQVARAVLLERLGAEMALYDADLLVADLNVISSPVQNIRMVFDLMPTQTRDDWETIAKRLAAVPATLDGVRAALSYGVAHGRVAALRQVEKVAEQCATWAGMGAEPAFFTTFIADAPQASQASLGPAAAAASAAYGELAGFLREEIAPHAPRKDAVGAEIYGIWLKFFNGATVDLAELYQWGWEEFFRIESEMKQVAGRIKPGASLAEAAAALDASAKYQVVGQDALQRWMQELSDEALLALRGTHFDLPDELMRLECRIAPPGGGAGAYYTGPNDDFSRPGRMWWSLVPGQETFSTWRETTTVYHEGVPGHHLQIATSVYQAETLNRYQRLMAGTSGHAEGWALYAERLMRELGFLTDDGVLMGMLDGHLFRAARVIIDLGMHLELEIPPGTGFHEGERWTPELGLEFMTTRTITDAGQLPDEVDRYLGWPGQAPAYKLGERVWLAARDDAKQRDPENFDVKVFHKKALEMGSMGLDTLRERLARL